VQQGRKQGKLKQRKLELRKLRKLKLRQPKNPRSGSVAVTMRAKQRPP
jgi:hypothetical protein